MPPARPPAPPVPPAPVAPEEARYIVDAVSRYFGPGAVVRSWDPDPKRLSLHVETDRDIGLSAHECLGLIMCEIARDYISMDVTRRGERPRGNAKIAYRQGVILGET